MGDEHKPVACSDGAARNGTCGTRSRHSAVQRRIHEILEPAAEGDRASRVFDIFIMTVIALSVLSVALETVASVTARWGGVLRVFEVFSVAVFTIEYALRLWSVTADPRYSAPLAGRLRWMVTPMAVIDLLAILPFYLNLARVDLRFLRALRLFRLFRVLKLARYSDSLALLGRVFRSKKEELVVTLTAVLFLLFLSSSLVYYVENGTQPEAFSSIPASLWWGVATLTTVGYGDIYPVTAAGRVLGAAIAILSIGLFALPAGILASGFAEEMRRGREEEGVVCPHCGGDIE